MAVTSLSNDGENNHVVPPTPNITKAVADNQSNNSNETLQQVDNNNKRMRMNPILNKLHRTTIPNMTSKEEMFAISTDYSSLDDCLDKARASSEEQFSIATFIQGRKPPKKKRKTCDLCWEE